MFCGLCIYRVFVLLIVVFLLINWCLSILCVVVLGRLVVMWMYCGWVLVDRLGWVFRNVLNVLGLKVLFVCKINVVII